jgi:hypothetical protein
MLTLWLRWLEAIPFARTSAGYGKSNEYRVHEKLFSKMERVVSSRDGSPVRRWSQ